MKTWLVTTSTLALMATAVTHAQAQEASPENSGSLETIIVTAQKRAQDAQDVPIAVAAFSANDLEAQGLQNVDDIAKVIPNVELYQGNVGTLPTWVIRGVGLQDFNANNTPTAPLYVDEIYKPSNAQGGLALYDLESVEVLKGPQGGLYGRNTSGGVVLARSAAPSLDEIEGYATTGYGSFGLWRAEGAVSVPVLENTLGVRVAGFTEQSNDGYQTSISTGETHGEKDRWGARLSALLDAGPGSLQVIVRAGEDNSEQPLARANPLYNAQGTFCDSALSGQRDDTCFTYAELSRAFSGQPIGLGASDQSSNAEDVLADPINRSNNKDFGVTAIGTLEFGDFTLTSVTGYDDFEYGVFGDADGTFGEYGHLDTTSDIEGYQQELRLQYDGDRLTGLVGVSYAQDEFVEQRLFLFRDNFIITQNIGLPDPSFGISSLDYEQTTESFAVFAQGEYEFTDAWSASLSLRYTDETKEYRNGRVGFPLAGIDNLFGPPVSSDYDLDDPISGKAVVSWTPNDNALIYGSFSKGFKVGGIFGGFGLDTTETFDPYDEETIYAYELGAKLDMPSQNLRLNGAVFYYDYRDVQAFATQQSQLLSGPNGDPTIITVLDNVGDAEHIGLEADVLWLPIDGLTLSAGGAWLDAEITDSDRTFFSAANPNPVSFEGQKRVDAPEFSGFARVRYEHPLTDMLGAAVSVDVNGRTDIVRSFGSAVSRAQNEVEGNVLVNGRLEAFTLSQRWVLSLTGRNLLDEEAVLRGTGDGLGSNVLEYNQPRSFLAEARVNF